MPELLACFNRPRMREFETGRFDAIFPKERQKAHQDGTPHLIVRVYAIHSSSEQFLVQKRGPDRQSNPNKFTDSASGHVEFREHFQFEHIVDDARRELGEEMGLQTLAIEFWTTYFSEGEQELVYSFFAVVDGEVCPDLREVDVEQSHFYTKAELIHLLANADFIPQVKTQWEQILSGDRLPHFLAKWNKKMVGESDLLDGPGVLIGRFQPFHWGHLLLLQEVVRRHGAGIVIIGSKQYSRLNENPFTYGEREQMIRDSLPEVGIAADQVEIFGIDDKHDAPKWVNEIYARLPQGAVLYSNSDWIRNLFSARGVHIGDVLKYNFNEYNGTTIRTKIYCGQEWGDQVPQGTKVVVENILQAGELDALLQAPDA